MKEKGVYSNAAVKDIISNGGSVQHVDWLTDDEKAVFKTAFEIDQKQIVRLASARQRYIDQTQSLNLAFDPTDSPRWINQVHMEAWKLGIKTLYYLRTDSVIKGDLGSRTADCLSCDG
jgi:ribonucleoside-diphosphate reductase alpha chain